MAHIIPSAAFPSTSQDEATIPTSPRPSVAPQGRIKNTSGLFTDSSQSSQREVSIKPE